MKITKDVLSTKDKRSMLDLLKREKPEPKYDNTLELHVTKQEWDVINNEARVDYKGSTWLRESVINFDSLEELIVPESKSETFKWLTFKNIDKEVKEALLNKARSLNLTPVQFVRSIVWTTVRQEQDKRDKRKKASQEAVRRGNGFNVTINLSGELLDKYEKKYGKVNKLEEAFNGVREIVTKDLHQK